MTKRKPVTLSFKDPDFSYALADHGLPKELVTALTNRAEFGEYWTLELIFKPDGTFTGKVVR